MKFLNLFLASFLLTGTVVANPSAIETWGVVRLAASRAIANGNLKTLAALVERLGLHVDAAIERDGSTLLHDAVLFQQDEIVKYLIRKKAAVNVKNDDGYTPLDLASKEMEVILQKAGAVRGIVSRGAPPLSITAIPYSDDPLFHAVLADDVKGVEALLSAGADPNMVSSMGFTPLTYAAMEGYVEVASTLIEYGADANEVGLSGSDSFLYVFAKTFGMPTHDALEVGGFFGKSAVTYAARYGHEDVVKLLASHKADLDNALIFLAAWGHEEGTKLLLDHEANPNAVGREGITPLIASGTRGYLGVVGVLLDRGADINAVDDNDQSAFVHAGKKGQRDVMELLLSRGAKVNKEDWVAVLNAAAQNGYLETVKLALERGTNPDAALFYAAKEGHIDVARVLLEWKANPNWATDYERVTALMYAAARHDKEMIKLLLKYDADVNARKYGRQYGESAISFVTDKEVAEILLDAGADASLGELLRQALSYGRLELAEFFLDRGADPNERYHLERTPLIVAAHRPGEWPPLGECEECIKMLLDRGAKAELTDALGQTAFDYVIGRTVFDYVKGRERLKEIADILRPLTPIPSGVLGSQ